MKPFARSLTLLIAMFATAAGLLAQEGPWPAKVEGFAPPQPGEHPRLFFRKSDLPALRARTKTPEGKALIARLKMLLGGGESMPEHKNNMTTAYGKKGGPKPQKEEWPEGTYSISHAAGFGFLYQLTGDQKYADLGRKCFEWAFEGVRDRDREGRYSWKQPGGALRAGPSLGWYAVGYDLCYDGWEENFRRKVTEAIENYDEGKFMSLAELAQGKRHMPGSNHWGMQVGGGALALLTIHGDPGVDNQKIEKLLEANGQCMIRNLTQGFGDHGWFAEGDGTGCMSSNISFIPALIAWREAGGRDYITPRPNAPWMTMKWVLRTLPKDGGPDFLKLGAYPHNVWAREGISGGGLFSQGFGAITEQQKPALLWLYQRTAQAADEKRNAPCDTPSGYPHHAVMAYLNWPFDLQEKNPAECIPRAVADQTFGFYVMRNRFENENDILVQIQTQDTRGWHRAKTNGEIHIWGRGQKAKWGRLKGKVTHWQPAADGSGILTINDGTSLAVDFSKASGAEAMLVMTGPGAGSGTQVNLGDRRVSFYFLTSGQPPVPKADGQQIVVGRQTVRIADGNLVLEKMAGSPRPAAGR